VTNHLAVAGLCADIVGVFLLARGVVLLPVTRYVEENPGPLFPRSANPRQDLAHAESYADARVGLSALLMGFAAQGVASAGVDPHGSIAPAIHCLAGLLIAIALGARSRIRRRREREVYLAQLRAYPGELGSAHEAWRLEMERRGRGAELRPWAEQASREFADDLGSA
jgi:hypothetical protein